MSPLVTVNRSPLVSFPRVSGDEPLQVQVDAQAQVFSRRERG